MMYFRWDNAKRTHHRARGSVLSHVPHYTAFLVFDRSYCSRVACHQIWYRHILFNFLSPAFYRCRCTWKAVVIFLVSHMGSDDRHATSMIITAYSVRYHKLSVFLVLIRQLSRKYCGSIWSESFWAVEPLSLQGTVLWDATSLLPKFAYVPVVNVTFQRLPTYKKKLLPRVLPCVHLYQSNN